VSDTAPYDAWGRATLALSLLAVDPEGLRGLWLRARSGPVRDCFVGLLDALPLPRRKIHPGITDDQLFGGVDLSATLTAGHLVRSRGLLAEPAALVLAMAERCPPGLAVRLGQTLDARTHCVVALDEGAEADETLPAALAERLAFFVALDDVPISAIGGEIPDAGALAAARTRLRSVILTPAQSGDLALLAAQCGIDSLRAPLLALAAARASAALEGRGTVTAEDLERAAALVYGHRALTFPETAPPEAEPPPPEPETTPDQDTQDDTEQGEITLPEELLLEAVRASLPPDVLARLAAGRAARAKSGASGTGAARRGNRRGRPLPSRPGKLDGTSKIDLVATLRAAAPWQPLRRAASPRGHLVHIRPEDIRVKRFQETSDRLLVFTVDASGSAAMARLGEAKGAVELLLAEAYARRDHVALIAFRGEGAELLLPPTRSLVQTKRRLAGLPGGGGTPLAHGLQAAMELAHQARARGMTPTLALLTDGRANIALDGTANRERAGEDATRLARALRATGTPAVVIDTANRPQEALRALAGVLDAPYIALPRADAHRLSRAVSAALAD
jgi:magnesium chelatase subunit D